MEVKAVARHLNFLTKCLCHWVCKPLVQTPAGQQTRVLRYVGCVEECYKENGQA